MHPSSMVDELIKWAGLTPEQVQKARVLQGEKRVDFAKATLLTGIITQEHYRDFMAMHLGMPVVDPSCMHIPREILGQLERSAWTRYQAIPFCVHQNRLYLACFEPDNITALDDIQFMTGMEVLPHLATLSSIQRAIDRLADRDTGRMDDILAQMEAEEGPDAGEGPEKDETSSLEAASQAPVVKMVNLIIQEAIRKKASDIHIEPYEKDFRVRLRLDGMLTEVMRPPIRMKNALISRLKIMSHLNIAEKRLPQDGRIKVRSTEGNPIEFRVSILPTLFGEKVVMRILDKSMLQVDMHDLGLEGHSLKVFQEAITMPYGMVLVTGPTGSGKTTTLYSAIMELNQEGVNISTAEDPVEFSLHGVNQVQVQEGVGLTFASVLRSFLRQDPDIILVGEIRDLETAEIAVKAALTGHLVLATLHTNDAPSTLTRLLNMGVDSFLVASSINAIMSQRLVRRLCPACRVAEHELEVLKAMGMDPQEVEQGGVFRAAGCQECNSTGFRGRTGVYEVMPNTAKIQEMVLAGKSDLELRRTAVEEGMITMRKSGLIKMSQGMTSAQEVLRVTVN
ncbi:type IV-A pilus assembly ATPase PilB [Desulfonatronospira sp.]|uniref:type IV-A pilus assembly ATPase PilB n=1 Tax=Desulfonatronospira sp. TaxID=1962951 RepID=UPI0025BF2D9D|nr:type IV-A pilus assembly ATPase PilB [Desulfonatronospira sp.]